MTWTLDLKKFYLVEKEQLAMVCFYTGMLLAYLGSLNPWFLWPVAGVYMIPAACCVMAAMWISGTMKNPVFSRQDYMLPLLAYIVLSFYLLFVNSGNINGYIANVFHIIIFFSLFRLNKEGLFRLTTFLSKAMAVLLIPSIIAFFLYLVGFSFPSRNTQFGDALYTYTNYYLFMIDDRALVNIFPRFHSVFLEPGHLGTATVQLLLAQCGHWKRWYNRVLLVTTLMTFSLAAYVLLVVIVFLQLWMLGRHFIRKMLLSVGLVAGVAVGAVFYNDGDNLLYNLILLRMEVDDEGDLSGDNRVSDWFEGEYDSYLKSSDIFFGRDYDKGISGNSGYRMYIYENGIVGTFLVFLFYVLAMMNPTDRRAWISTWIITVLTFWVRGYPLWYSNFIPLYALVFVSGLRRTTADKQLEEICDADSLCS